MNTADQLEREVTAWFADTATPRVPDYTDDILQSTVASRQRPRWSFPERWLPMSVTTLGRRTLAPLPWRTIGLLAILALLIAASLAFYVGSRSHRPAPLGLAGNGLLAMGANQDIVLIDPSTGERMTLVGGASNDGSPIWSPDGTRVAFDRLIAGEDHLMAVDVNGGRTIDLATVPDGIYGLVWSQDGAALSFVNGKVWVVRSDGSGGGPIENGVAGVGYPAWRPPDGRQLLFDGDQGGTVGPFLMNRDGSGVKRLTTTINNDSAMWTPDGQRLVTIRTESESGATPIRRIHVLTLGPDDTVVADRVVGPEIHSSAGGYFLSPDGTRVAFPVEQSSGSSDARLGIIAIDGDGTVIETGPVFAGEGNGYGWSPDGTTLVLVIGNKSETWLLDASGGPGRQAAWDDGTSESPDWQRK
jgi:Tol biopolymer transport system component